MGMERAVTLWYLHRQVLLNELALLEAQLMQIGPVSEHEAGPSEVRKGAVDVALVPTIPIRGGGADAPLEIEEQYKSVQEKLRDLGPCPRPMMG